MPRKKKAEPKVNEVNEQAVLPEEELEPTVTAPEQYVEDTTDEFESGAWAGTVESVADPKSPGYAENQLTRESEYLHRQIERQAYQERTIAMGIMQAALKTKSIQEGKIVGVESDGKDVYWVIIARNVMVKIPFLHCYQTTPKELFDKATVPADLRNRRRQFLRKAIGATVSFVLLGYVTSPSSDGEDYFIGSRTTALARIRKSFFGAYASKKIEEGMDVSATILTVGRSQSCVTAFGMDFLLPNYRLTHRYVDDLQDEFAPGHTLPIRVQSIVWPEMPAGTENKQTEVLPVITLNARPIELMKYTTNVRYIKPGMVCSARITSIRKVESPEKGQRLRFYLFLEDWNCVGYSHEAKIKVQESEVHTGDIVQLEVQGVNAQGYVYGKVFRRK